MADSLPLEMLTYILSFLPLSDQKEASLVSRTWYCAAQNALREVRPHLVHSYLFLYSPSHGPAYLSSVYPSLYTYTFILLVSGCRAWSAQVNRTSSS
ncbi:leucine rich repeat containing 29, isoform CRA_a [Mus musculus]|uniref:Leucine rich repeat containing 29 n=1 Tax=Mus musculus TaxID=10090 RepID=Q8K020_MOUSE|nr:Leucine rich repeat containing 29 [Mus musculus]EDL11270.1 leucine rich repeat containing 29, isoform CRA_a [Mus musculus]